MEGRNSKSLTFRYQVGAGQNTASLAATAINLNGATVQDNGGNAANLLLNSLAQTGQQIDTAVPTVSSVMASGTGITAGTGDLGAGSVVKLTVTGAPTLSLNYGGTATYAGGTGTNALTFSYTVAPSDSAVSALAITGVNLPSGATIKDAAGNIANLSGAVMTFSGLKTDPLGPAPPAISSFSPDTGVVGDGFTNASTLILTGTAAANSTVKIFDGSTQIGTTAASSTGSWDYITSALNDAKHILTAEATDSSGQTSAASSALSVTVDTHVPVAPVLVSDSVVNTNHMLLSDTAEANSTIKVFDGTAMVGTTTAAANGAWNVTTGVLASGSHILTATATDVAGTTCALYHPLDPVIGLPATSAPTISSFSPDTGKIGDHITNAKTLTLTGTPDANSTVELPDGMKQIGTAPADGSGAWKCTTAALADGSHSLTATETNFSRADQFCLISPRCHHRYPSAGRALDGGLLTGR